MTKSFEELRRRVAELEKSARRIKFTPPAEERDLGISMEMLSFDDLLNELDKLYKVKAAKEYLARRP